MIFVFFVFIPVIRAEDFITEFEYGQMLYHDPHGASCAACHGETGEGGIISEYTDKQGRTAYLKGPDIRSASLAQIRHSVANGMGVMPRYFLTEKEIETIYAYLQKVNKKKKSSISELFESTKKSK